MGMSSRGGGVDGKERAEAREMDGVGWCVAQHIVSDELKIQLRLMQALHQHLVRLAALVAVVLTQASAPGR